MCARGHRLPDDEPSRVCRPPLGGGVGAGKEGGSMTVAVANFIEMLLVHYPVKHDSEEREDAWVDSMVAALKAYPADVLEEVGRHIIRTRKYRNFPLLSEIMDAADAVEERRQNIARAQTLP